MSFFELIPGEYSCKVPITFSSGNAPSIELIDNNKPIKQMSEENKKVQFKKHDLILHEDVNWQCICADNEIAVFARFQTVHEKDGTRNDVDYDELFSVSNNFVDDNFEYELIDG